MQAELNKYFYNDISNIISDYHYKTQFYEVMKELTDFIKENTWLIDDDNEDSEDEDDQPYEIKFFIGKYFSTYKSRIRKIKRQNTMTEELTDSDREDELGFIGTKKHHRFRDYYYSPEEFAYKFRYPDADDSEDCDF
jgi:hypothetical protein